MSCHNTGFHQLQTESPVLYYTRQYNGGNSGNNTGRGEILYAVWGRMDHECHVITLDSINSRLSPQSYTTQGSITGKLGQQYGTWRDSVCGLGEDGP